MKRYKDAHCCVMEQFEGAIIEYGLRGAINWIKEDFIVVDGILHHKECSEIKKCPFCNTYVDSYDVIDSAYCLICEDEFMDKNNTDLQRYGWGGGI